MTNIEVLRLINSIETVVETIPADSSEFHQSIMGEQELVLDVVVDSVLDVQEGDYVMYNGIKYTLTREADYKIVSKVNYSYTMVFEHPYYILIDKLITNSINGNSVFTLTGTLSDFVDLIISIINYDEQSNPLGVDTGWTKGSVINSDYKPITFSGSSCMDALTELAKQFDAEYYFVNKQINFTSRIENETGLTFAQGKDNGLYDIDQKSVDKENTITRIFPVGGNKNVPNEYADEEGNLKLPEGYLENFEEYTRVVEKRVVFEDIYPTFTGTINSVSGEDNISIICPEIDFDLNTVAVGDTARINFLTGSLMGISFQFSYNHSTNTVTLIPQNDETALTADDGSTPQVPRPLKKASAGDKFNFTGIILPAGYISIAIDKLRTKATDWLGFYSRKRVKFELNIDYRWMRTKSQLFAGDLVTISIPEKNLSKILRVNSVQQNLKTGALTAIVSNYLDEKWQQKVDSALTSLQSSVTVSNEGGGVGSSVDVLEKYDERPASDRNVMSSLRSRKEFLRKDAEDTAAERITFNKGAVVNDLATKNFTQGEFTGAGAGIFKDAQGNTVLETDKLHVRQSAFFNEIVINQIKFQGGIVVYSAANMEVFAIEALGSATKIYFDTKNGQVVNQFVVNDLIRCQKFSGGSIIKYYSSMIVEVGSDYITIYNGSSDGTLNVEVGDILVQFGNTSDPTRQSIIEVNVLDGGRQTFYQGVNSYDLSEKNMVDIGRVLISGTWKNIIRSFGNAYIGNRDLSSYVKYDNATGAVEIKADVSFKKATGVYESLETALINLATDAQDYVDAAIAGLQDQLDGVVVAWFYPYSPTTSNVPASDWTTEALKQEHIGDTFTNTEEYIDDQTTPDAGKSWRWLYDDVNMTYSWNIIGDNLATQALLLAQNAKDTADGKRRVFVAEPVTPYEIGDLWMSGPSGEIKKCKTERLTGNYYASDWELASKYTDDTAADQAQQDANTANTAISVIVDDNKLSANEKGGELSRWNDIANEKSGIDLQATVYGITTEKTAYDTAFQNLANYLNGGTVWSSGTPLWFQDLTTNTSIAGSTYRTKWNTYYTARQTLLNVISKVSKENVDLLEVRFGKTMFSDTFNETLAQFNSRWTNYIGGGEISIEAVSDATGGNVLRIGNNTGDDQGWLIGNNSVPYDPTRLYVVRARIRRTAGTNGYIYVGIAGRNADDSAFVNVTGLDQFSSQFYLAASDIIPSNSEWVEYKGYFKGFGTYISNNSVEYPTPLHQNVRNIRPIVIVNYPNKSGTFEIDYVNIEYADAESALYKALATEYLKSALEGSTDITGGLLATNILLMKNANSDITAGMSGLNSDNIAFWGGGSYADAIAGLAKIILKKDGSGQLAGGNILWDENGNLNISAAINALSGNIGLFNIVGSSLISGKLTFADEAVETLASLMTPFQVDISHQASWDYSAHSNGGNAYTQEITVTGDAILKFKATANSSVSSGNKQYRVCVKKSGITIYDSGLQYGTLLNELFTINVTAGSYQIYVYVLSFGNLIGEYYANIFGDVSATTISAYQSVAITKIGNNGFYSFWASNKYLYFSSIYGFEARFGNIGLRFITGQTYPQKMVIGNWSNL